MKLSDLKIGTRLLAAFSTILLLILAASYIIFVRTEMLTEMTVNMYKHPFTVTNAIRSVKANSEKIREHLNSMVIFPETADSLSKAIDSLDHQILRSLDLAKERYLGEKHELEHLIRAYSALAASRGRVIADVKSGDIEAAKIELMSRKSLVSESADMIQKVLDFASNKSNEFYLNAIDLQSQTYLVLSITLVMLLLLSGITGFYITRYISTGVGTIVSGIREIGSGDYSFRIKIDSKDEIGSISAAINSVSESLEKYSQTVFENKWVTTGLNDLSVLTRDELSVPDLAKRVAGFIADRITARVVAVFTFERSSGRLLLSGGYGLPADGEAGEAILEATGLANECASRNRMLVLDDVPAGYFHISSALGSMEPRSILLLPLSSHGKVVGVLEAGLLSGIDDKTREFITAAAESIGIALESAASREELSLMLQKTLELADELHSQQEELQVTNEELEEQTNALRISEEKLRSQQEELEVVNEELEEKNESLFRQKADIQAAREQLEIKAEELAIASRYKSEFLANMSHELRTPLNSLLILSQMLAANRNGNLSEEEKESASLINKSGSDLLHLINEILDLSKIEAGKMQLHIDTISVAQLLKNLESGFRHMVAEKGLKFEFIIDEDSVTELESDRMRVEQILKNLISNSIKFTEKGSITVRAGKPDPASNLFRSELKLNDSIAISVSDTGIGIPVEKQKVIFEAFQQADGSTSRKYGGTGLGLSICRELASILGGEIQLQSKPGKGSTFTLFLPLKFTPKQKVSTDKKTGDATGKTPAVPARENNSVVTISLPAAEPGIPGSANPSIRDDRDAISGNDQVVLIIEDDPVFADHLYKECREKNFKAVVALTGNEGLILARQFMPMAVLLDLGLPDINGIDVLGDLKESSETRHIPVHIISGSSDSMTALLKGAMGFLTKPVSQNDIDEVIARIENFYDKKVKDILLIEDDNTIRKTIVKLLGDSDVRISSSTNGTDAIQKLESNTYDLVILDIGLPDMSGFELLHFLDAEHLKLPPVIVYTGKELSREEEAELRYYADSIIIKGVKSEERLLDEASLFLHRLVKSMPEKKRKMIIDLHETDAIFKDKKVLLVDDDMRNVFALSKLLTEKGMKILKAENGEKALEIVNSGENIDLILMDIMMPVMDGYETTRRIRAIEKFEKIPIIAVTAKAMKKDYEECLAAGASDYLPKPVDIERLFSLMRVWLYR